MLTAFPKTRSLVTGGSGFLGSYLVAALAKNGHSVSILDPMPPTRLPEGVHYIAGSVHDASIVRHALADVGCVYHLAGIAQLWTPGPDDFDRVNHRGTEVILDAAKEMGVSRLVYCSSYTTLVSTQKRRRPINETLAIVPDELAGPYSRSKYHAETAVRKAVADGLNVVIVNPTILVGAQDHNLTPGTAMLSHFLHARSFWYTEMLLNVGHVQDVAAGMMLAAALGRNGERYLLGGENITLQKVLDVIDRITRRVRPRTQVPSALTILAGRAAEMIAVHLTRRVPLATVEGAQIALHSGPVDLGRAKRELGYQPRCAELALTDALQWLHAVR